MALLTRTRLRSAGLRRLPGPRSARSHTRHRVAQLLHAAIPNIIKNPEHSSGKDCSGPPVTRLPPRCHRGRLCAARPLSHACPLPHVRCVSEPAAHGRTALRSKPRTLRLRDGRLRRARRTHAHGRARTRTRARTHAHGRARTHAHSPRPRAFFAPAFSAVTVVAAPLGSPRTRRACETAVPNVGYGPDFGLGGARHPADGSGRRLCSPWSGRRSGS